MEPYIYLRKTTTPGFEESEDENKEEGGLNTAKSKEMGKQESNLYNNSDKLHGRDGRLRPYPEMPQGEIGNRIGKFLIVGIGGCGGNLAASFLKRHDSSKIDKLMRLIGSNISEDLKGLWIEADKVDAYNQNFFKPMFEGSYPVFFIPHEIIEYGSRLHTFMRDKYGYDLKKQGFFCDAQYLKAIFEIFQVDEGIQHIAAENMDRFDTNPIFDGVWDAIRPYTTLGEGDCQGILFLVSFGGGTGAGFINPIINRIRNSGIFDFPIFVLGILTEPSNDHSRTLGRRNLAAISSIYDLLTMHGGANGVILVDNQILLSHFGDYSSANEFVRQMMLPRSVSARH